MNLKNISDSRLLENCKRLVSHERELLTEILWHLREVEKRRLFSELRYPSLFSYVVGELKYSEDQAYRRISAMRLLRDLPQVEEKIASGELNLSQLTTAQNFFRHEEKAGRKMDVTAKAVVLEKLELKSIREGQKVLESLSPNYSPRKKLNFQDIEDEQLREKLLHVKGLLGHSHPGLDLEGLLHVLCDQEINRQMKKRLEPAPKAKREMVAATTLVTRESTAPTQSAASRAKPISSNENGAAAISDKKISAGTFGNSVATPQVNIAARPTPQTSDVTQTATATSKADTAKAAAPATFKVKSTSTTLPAAHKANRPAPRAHIPAAITRHIWSRDQACCTNCGSKQSLQKDHRTPKAHQGADTKENLRLLCRPCNQRAAITKIGTKKMNPYLKCVVIEYGRSARPTPSPSRSLR